MVLCHWIPDPPKVRCWHISSESVWPRCCWALSLLLINSYDTNSQYNTIKNMYIWKTRITHLWSNKPTYCSWVFEAYCYGILIMYVLIGWIYLIFNVTTFPHFCLCSCHNTCSAVLHKHLFCRECLVVLFSTPNTQSHAHYIVQEQVSAESALIQAKVEKLSAILALCEGGYVTSGQCPAHIYFLSSKCSKSYKTLSLRNT